MKKTKRIRPARLDAMIEEATVDAYDESEMSRKWKRLFRIRMLGYLFVELPALLALHAFCYAAEPPLTALPDDNNTLTT